jgi:RNA polymerase sigma-70 factor (ECF subfamily)
MDDVAILRAALERHGSVVFAIALRISGNRAAAEEIAQDVFLELWRSGKAFASPEHLGYWLRKVAVHRATDALRRGKTQPAYCAEAWCEETEPDGPKNTSLPAPLSDRLGSMLLSLPDAMRVALALRYGEDEMTPEEIAEVLGQPTATVKSNLARGLHLLRRKAQVTLKEFVRG